MDLPQKTLEKQYELERQYRGFISSLDRSRTATLRQVLQNPEESLDRLNAPWINFDQLAKRIVSMEEFFSKIQPHERIKGYAGIPLIFLQSTNNEEDKAKFKFLREVNLGDRLIRNAQKELSWEEYFSLRWEFEGLPIETPYLGTNFFPQLIGTWRSGKRIITPLFQFTSRGQFHRDNNGKNWDEKPMMIGYRVPNYPELLDVNHLVATDYLARILVHDLGHGFLPSVDLENESLHNATMKYALNVRDDLSKNLWEKLVHAESTNPFFFLEIGEYFERPFDNRFSPTQQYIAQEMLSWKRLEFRKNSPKDLWGITGNMDLGQSKRKVVNVINEMTQNGFAQYGG